MIAKFALALLLAIATVLVSSSSNLVDAQATVITAGASGSTSPIQGIIISKLQFENATGLGKYVPYAYTNMDVAAETTTDLILIHTNGQSAMAFEWNIIWNFTSAESTTIRSFFSATTPMRNNLEVRFTATWNSDGRFAIDTASWTYVFQSLMPYGIGPGCNIQAAVMASRGTLVALPDACIATLVPGQKALAQATSQCLIMHGRTALDISVACSTVRAFLETVYCTDGSAGVDAVCKYNNDFLPSGKPGPVVLTVGADGFATSGRKTGGGGPSSPGSAGSVFAGVVATVAVIVAMMI